MKKTTALVLFVYNRLLHTRQTIEYLKRNELAPESKLFIFSEFPKNAAQVKKVEEVREYIATIEGFKEIQVIARNNFNGLAKSVISGITEIFQTEDSVIVLEDDITTAPGFLNYMNEALEKYEHHDRIFSVTGFNYPLNLFTLPLSYTQDVYLAPRSSSWGWGTWKNRWDKADWQVKDFNVFENSRSLQEEYNKTGKDKSRMLIKQMRGEIDSWAIRWDYTHFKNNAYCLYPVHSLVNNIGADKSGRHTNKTKKYFNDLTAAPDKIILPDVLTPDKKVIEEFVKIFDGGGNIFRIKNALLKYIKKLTNSSKKFA